MHIDETEYVWIKMEVKVLGPEVRLLIQLGTGIYK